jgi:rhodanese-related sulfurtransferase
MSTSKFSPEYAGDLANEAAWALLKENPNAQLVDVRTVPEWSFVGGPDLSSVGRQVHRIEWQTYPSMAVNPDFVGRVSEALSHAGAGPDTPLLFLCRSGARSRAAAIAMTDAGFKLAYNVAGGFEGDMDEKRHRGSRNGWKAAGLPWGQT